MGQEKTPMQNSTGVCCPNTSSTTDVPHITIPSFRLIYKVTTAMLRKHVATWSVIHLSCMYFMPVEFMTIAPTFKVPGAINQWLDRGIRQCKCNRATCPVLALDYIGYSTTTSIMKSSTLILTSQESGNPAVDDLRERVAELAGINLVDFLEEGKGSGAGGQAQGGKGKGKVWQNDLGCSLYS